LTTVSDGRKLAAEPHGLPDPTTAIIGQIGLHLSRMAEMVYAIDEAEYQDHRRTAFVDCFLLDFRALSYFLWGGKSTEVRCYDFVDIKNWQPRKTDATKRMHKLAVIVSKHRAHLSWSRLCLRTRIFKTSLVYRILVLSFSAGCSLTSSTSSMTSLASCPTTQGDWPARVDWRRPRPPVQNRSGVGPTRV
jgi:hypothetical protein